MEYRVISADCHIDLPWLPADLFVANAPAQWKPHVPQVVDTSKGKAWQADGIHLGYVGGVGSFGREYIPGSIHRADRMATTGLYEDGKKGLMRPTTPELRLQDQARDGIQAEVIYGILGVANRLNNPELTNIVYQIYNTWLADFCRTHPDRFAGLACIPNHDAKLAADEVRRVAKLGLRGAELNVNAAIEPLWHPFWEPLWTAAEECQLSIAFHTTGTGRRPPTDLDPKLLLAARASGLTQFQMATAEYLSSLIFGGVLQRHSGLRLVLGESGIGWIPYILDRMDYEYEDQFKELGLSLKPSEYWHRQMYATYQQDRIGIKLLDDVGVENVMWGSDYPHPDGIFPDSQTYLQRELAHLPEPIRRQIVCENAARLYGFPLI
jgi:predicted TIM-barrel fold metal-dependent hydrolase